MSQEILKKHYYFAYEQLLQSDFDLSVVGLRPVERMLSSNQQPLVVSNMGPLTFNSTYINNQTMLSSSGGYYFKKNIALFRFTSVNEIQVFIDYDQFNSDFVRTLLNYPIACAFYQKEIFSLHASAVAFKGKVIIFPGSALTGKSTIAAYFLKNGGQLITEDTAVIEIHGGKAYVRSSYPFIKLSKFANKELSFSSSDGILLPTDRNRRLGYLLNEKSFASKFAPVDYCIFLEFGDRESVEPIKSSEAVLKLLDSSLNIYPLTRTKQRQLFHWSANIARCLKIFRFRRRKGILLSRFLADFIAENKF